MLTFNEYMVGQLKKELIHDIAVVSLQLGIAPENINEALHKCQDMILEVDTPPADAPPAAPGASAFAPGTSNVGNTLGAMGSGFKRMGQDIWTGMKNFWKGDLSRQLQSAINAVTTFSKTLERDVPSQKDQLSHLQGLLQILNSFKPNVKQWQQEAENTRRAGGMHAGVPGHPGYTPPAPAAPVPPPTT
jgi:hypothetical protein